MNLKKTVLIAAAAGALAAVSVPAMAFENEFHGSYTFKYFLSNYDNNGSFAIRPDVYKSNLPMNNFFEQRARLQYIAKASDDLKLVTQFELDSRFGGQGGAQGAATGTTYKGLAGNNDAGQLEADSLTLETKHVYLDFNLGKSNNVKVGIQPIKDVFKGNLIDADIAGILTTHKFGNATLNLGYFRAYDALSIGATQRTGHDNFDLGAAVLGYKVNKNLTVGGAFYVAANYLGSNLAVPGNTGITTTGNGDAVISTYGLFFDSQIGKLNLSGFAAGQFGWQTVAGAEQYRSGYALNAAAKYPVGPGTLKTAILWATGDDGRDTRDTSWYSPTTLAGKSVTTYNESGMMLLNRNSASQGGSNDRNIIYNAGAPVSGAGELIYTLGYDATITPKLYLNSNVGFAWYNKNHAIPGVGSGVDRLQGRANGTDFIGTEFNVETGYKVYDNLTAKFQFAYVVLGGTYTNSAVLTGLTPTTPDDPYTARFVLSYAF